MIKKLISIITSVCLIAIMLPFNVTAQDQEVKQNEATEQPVSSEVPTIEETPIDEITIEQPVENESNDEVIEENIEDTELVKETRVAGNQRDIMYPARIIDIFPDIKLAQEIATALSTSMYTNITKNDLNGIIYFSAPSKSISDITGLDELSNAKSIDLSGNIITDISTVNWSKLSQLEILDFTNNRISTLGPTSFNGLSKLEKLHLGTNLISDLSQVNWAQLTSLQSLQLYVNNISDISTVPWNQMLSLLELKISNNKISDISSLPCDKFRVEAYGQAITLDRQNYTSPLEVLNPIKSYTGIAAPVDTVSNSGTYDGTTKKVSWNVPNGTRNVQFTWSDTDATVGGTTQTFLFSGTVTVPVEVKYKLQFLNFNGTVISETLVSAGEAITAPTETPTRTGYTYTGWSQTVPATMPAYGLTFYATFQINQYTVTFKNHNGEVISSVTQNYDSVVGRPAAPTRPGYWFEGWDPTFVNKVPDYDVTYTTMYRANIDTPYIIEYYHEKPEGGYAVGETVTKKGTTDTEVEAPIKAYGWTYSYEPGNEGNVLKGTIAGDGSLVLKVYYTLQDQRLTFKDYDYSIISQTQVRPGTVITPPTNLTRAGYVHTGWSPALPETMPMQTSEHVAVYTANTDTKYKVEFYGEKLDGTYEVLETDNLEGTTDSYVRPTPKDIAGYTYNQALSDVHGFIKGDGSLVVKMYYKRNSYTATFKNALTGEVSYSYTYKYGALITPQTPFTPLGYDGVTWSPSLPGTMPPEDTDFLYTFIPKTDTRYYVTHNGDALNYPGAVNHLGVDVLYGTTGAAITATPREFEGFTFNPDASYGNLTGTISGDGRTNLTVGYTRNTYQLKFVDYNDDEIRTSTLYYQEMFAAPTDPTRTGYTFTGWTPSVVKFMPAADTTYKATYTVNQYKVTFNDHDGRVISENTQDFNTTIEQPVNPTRAGYTFTGWTPSVAEKLPANDVSYTAEYTANTNTAYKTEYYQEQLDGTFTLFETVDHTGTTDTTANATIKTYVGFTHDTANTSKVESGTIAGNGSLVLKVYYKLNTYKVTFNDHDGTKLESTDLKFGEEINKPTNPDRTGYTFTGWTPTVATTMPAENLTYTAEYTINSYKVTFKNYDGSIITEETKNFGAAISTPTNNPTRAGYTFTGWTPAVDATVPARDVVYTAEFEANTDTAYKTEYVQEQLDGTFTVFETVDHTGTTDATVDATIKTYAGFTHDAANANKVESGTVVADGSLVLKVYYTLNTYKVTFNDHDGTEIENANLKFGATISTPTNNPTRAGYTFTGWTPSVAPTMPANDVTYTAEYTANTNTAYKVEYYQEQLDGTFTVFETVDLTGTTDETVDATIKTYAGFTHDAANANKVESGTVTGDGSLVLKVYYTLNTYKVTFNNYDGTEIENANLKFGATISTPTNNPTRVGYTFAGWTPTVAATMPANDVTYTATYTANTDTAYKVEYYQEQLDGTFTVFETVDLTGTTNETVDATIKTYAGFTHDAENANKVETGTVTANGSLVLKVYYTLNTYKVTFNNYDGTEIENANLKFGATISTPANNPTRVGYTFTGWTPSVATTMPANDVTYTATYVAGTATAYKVEYYQEQLDGTFVLFETDNRQGTTDTTVEATINTYDGFTHDDANADKVESGTVAADGSLTLKVYYSRNTYKVTFNNHDGTEIENANLKFGATISTPTNNPTRDGYTFAGWTPTVATTMPANDVTYTADYTANTDTAYKVEYVQEQLDGTFTVFETVDLTGTTDATVDATIKTYAGFTHDATNANKVESGTVVADGSLVLKVYYTLNTYKVTFNDHDGTEIENANLKFGATISTPTNNPTRVGYTFTGWTPTVAATMPAEDVTYTAEYTAKADTSYKVEYYQEQLDGTFVLFETDNRQGTTDATVDATVKTYAGFTHDAANANKVESGSVAADGSLVLKVYYTLNTFKVTFNDHDGTEIASNDLKFGAAITKPDDPTRTGYTFAGWTPTVATTMPANDVTYTATYVAGTATAYKVEYYQEQLDGTFVLFETDNRQGTTEATVEATINTYVGFTHDDANANKVESGTVAGDGSLVLKVYYKLNTYKVTFNDHDGTEIENANLKFGATISKPANNPTRVGYTFAGWTPTVAATMPAEDVTYTAEYTANTDTAYKVEYYQEQLDGTFTVFETVDHTGTTNETVDATIKTYAGFTHDAANANKVESGTVTGDGSLVLKVYYTLNTYKVTFNDHDGTEIENANLKFGATISTPANNPTRVGYTFTGWTPTVAATMPAEDVTYTAEYTAKADTSYKVEYYQEQLDGTFVLFETDNRQGTTDATVEAIINTYVGFTHDDANADKVESGSVAADGSLVLKVYYKLNTYKVTFNDHDGTEITSENLKFGATISTPTNNPTRVGYTFVGWTPTVAQTMPAEDVTYTADYTANTDTTYKVEYYQEQLDGTFTVFETVDHTGTTNETVDATIKTYAGFTHDAENANKVESGTVVADGSLVLKVYYTLNTYKVTFNDHDGTEIENANLKFGATISTPANNPTRVGYTFAGWTPTVAATMPAEDVTYTAEYTAKADTSYKVEYYQEQLDGTFVLFETDNRQGTTDATVEAIINTYVGFTHDDANTSKVESGTVTGDGSLVLKVYYKLNTYKVTFNDHDGTEIENANLKFGATISTPTNNPTRDGYTFTGWTPTVAPTMPANDVTYTAEYTANTDTAYKVEYVQEQLDGTFTVFETVDLTGTTNETVDATIKTYAGFTHDAENANKVESGTVAGDGSLVLKVYYTLNTYKVTFNNHDGTEIENANLKFGAAISTPANNPTRVGYTFAGWTPTVAATMPAEDVTYTADYTANTDTSYKVEYYQEQLDGTFTLFETVDETGTTDSTIDATIKTYAGFTHDAANANKVESGTVAADGSLVLKVYYTLNTNKVTFNDHDGTEITSENLKFGAAINAPTDPTREGYTFTGWTPAVDATVPANDVTYTAEYTINQYKVTFKNYDGTVVTEETKDFGTAISEPATNPTRTGYTFVGWTPTVAATVPAHDVEYTAEYSANTDTAYKVEYYQEQNDGTFTLFETIDHTGTTDADVNAVIKTYAGYIHDSQNADKVESGRVAEDGSLVLKVYYSLNTYKVTFNDHGGTVIVSTDLKFGAEITAPTDPTREGHTFTGWTPTVDATVPANDVVYTATYSVNSYTITFKDDEGTVVLTETKEYGTTITAPTLPLKAGYTFTGWTPTVDATVPANDVEYTATYALRTDIVYNVEYYQEQLDGTFTLFETVAYQGTTNATVDATIKTYAGFTHDAANVDKVEAGAVAADGSLVLKVYYTRNSYTITFKDHDGTELLQVTGKFGETYTVPNVPQRLGYIFARWMEISRVGKVGKAYRNLHLTIPSYHVTYIAVYNAEIAPPTPPTNPVVPVDDGGPMTEDACGVVTDRWGNVMYQPSNCQGSTGYMVPNTGDKK